MGIGMNADHRCPKCGNAYGTAVWGPYPPSQMSFSGGASPRGCTVRERGGWAVYTH